MFRTHTQPGWRALAVLVGGALLVAPVTPSQARAFAPPPPPPPPPAAKTPEKAPEKAPAKPPTEAPAGDENIPVETEEGERKPLEAGRGSSGAVQSASFRIGKKGSAEVGAELAAMGDAAFDAENYGEAARLYTKALELLSENETNHVQRSVILANCITAYEQVYATSREVDHLKTAQRILQEYLRACKAKHGNGCDRYIETQEARARLQSVMAEIDIAAPKHKKIPPEIDRAPGGKPYDIAVKLPPAPSWIAPTMVGGVLVAGGGAALMYYAATDDKYGPIYERGLGDTDTGTDTTTDTGTDTTTDTGTDTTTDGTDTGATGGSTVSGLELPPETKGKLLIGLGAFLAAAGIGFVILGAMGIAKHRRLNRKRAQALAVTPTFGRGSAGLALTGRF
jgi:hypothetical protein